MRLGLTPTAFKARAASSTAMMPVPLSVAPVPRSQLSMWPPIKTTSSALVGSGDLGDRVEDLDFALAEGVLQVDLDSRRARA